MSEIKSSRYQVFPAEMSKCPPATKKLSADLTFQPRNHDSHKWLSGIYLAYRWA
ncbi:hypothetical protein [Limihaloglobus sulfuriphilus]|uniref:hypothetical protein n=1 Tax=Limihaloglobus sulfuriphilus TaxID=1851148 RepID=UPI00164993FE|nr:hypothetical protein [Limihaloglobus sulfuriphilus]